MTNDDPYLSVVATSRNDDHGGNLLRRMQLFADGLIAQCRRFNLTAELVLVEWNPAPGRPGLAQALHWPADTGPCQVRIITVPERVHRRFNHARSLPLFQMIAKNAGIRRARGRFVLATNIDILFSDELMAHIAAGRLETNRLYRIDRHDVMKDVPYPAAITEQLDYCRSHLIRVNAREGTFNTSPQGEYTLSTVDVVAPDAGILLGRGWHAPEFDNGETIRWATDNAVLLVKDDPSLARVIHLEIEPGPGVGFEPFTLEVFDDEENRIAGGVVKERELVSIKLPEAVRPVERYYLRAPEGGQATPNDWRILNFRLYRCRRGDIGSDQKDGFVVQSIPPELRGVIDPQDIVDPDLGIRFGPGWHAVETWHGQRFRWAANNAALVFHGAGAGETMTLAIEPGPGVGYCPFDLQVRDTSGETVCSSHVDGESLTTLQLPLQPYKRQAFIFHVNGGGGMAPNDSRILNFRVFHPIRSGKPLLPFNRRSLIRKLTRLLTPWIAGFVKKLSERRTRKNLGKQLPAAAFRESSTDRFETIVSPVPLHLNASGDFTMLARSHWFDLKGYPEFEIYSLHIDSVFCYMAYHHGLVEHVFEDPMRAYHIEHCPGSGWTPEGQDRLFARMAAKKIPVLSAGELLHWATQMRRQDAPIIFNQDSWGLRDDELPEVTIGEGAVLSY